MLILPQIYSSPVSQSVPTSGLLLWWKFSEGSGSSVADSSGNGNTGTWTGTPAWSTGLSKPAAYFDGTASNYVTKASPAASVSSAYSLLCRIKFVSVTQWTPIFGIRGPVETGAYQGYELRTGNSKQILMEFGTGSGAITNGNGSGTTYTTGSWVDIGYSYDGSNFKSYLNGALDSTVAASGTVSVGTSPFYAGGPRQGSEDNFNLKAYVQHVMSYNRALSATEFSNIHSIISGD